jgi:hypothetical protein
MLLKDSHAQERGVAACSPPSNHVTVITSSELRTTITITITITITNTTSLLLLLLPSGIF